MVALQYAIAYIIRVVKNNNQEDTMKVRNTLEKFGCTETVYDVPDIGYLVREVYDDLFGSEACQIVRDMIDAGHAFGDDETPESDIAKELADEFVNALDILKE